MNSKEFEEISKYLEVDRSAELFGEPDEGEDSRGFLTHVMIFEDLNARTGNVST